MIIKKPREYSHETKASGREYKGENGEDKEGKEKNPYPFWVGILCGISYPSFSLIISSRVGSPISWSS